MTDVSAGAGRTDTRQTLERAALLDHDIRSAIADIIHGFQLADLSALDEPSQLLLNRTRQAAEQLTRLSQEALALAAGNDAHLETPFSILNILDFTDDLRARWRARGKFDISKGPDLPRLVGINQFSLERVLNNLIGNAFKYGGENRVELHISLQPKETLCFAVRDTGPGFSNQAKARLFDFAARDPDNPLPGSGHGLHIANSIARDLGGQLKIENQKAGGAQVSVFFPRSAWAPGVEQPGATSNLPDLKGQHVLVAEDTPTAQKILQDMLESLGATCALASDGQQAWDILSVRHVDLAVIDIEMPKLSGLDLVQQMRASPNQIATMPVLAVTAYVLNANRQEIYDAGADGILAKPIMSIEALAEGLNKVLSKDIRQDEATVPDTLGISSTHLDRLLAFSDQDSGLELLKRLLLDLAGIQSTLESAIEIGDFNQIRSGAHVLVALSGAVGDAALQQIAETLNDAARALDLHQATIYCRPAIDGTAKLVNQLAEEISARYGET